MMSGLPVEGPCSGTLATRSYGQMNSPFTARQNPPNARPEVPSASEWPTGKHRKWRIPLALVAVGCRCNNEVGSGRDAIYFLHKVSHLIVLRLPPISIVSVLDRACSPII